MERNDNYSLESCLKKRIWEVARVFCLLILISACAANPEPDRSLLTGEPCEAPCWHNIIPGESTEEDVWRELKGSPYVYTGTLNSSTTDVFGTRVTDIVWNGRGSSVNRITLLDNKVLLIRIELDYELSLEDVIEKFGPPRSVFANSSPAEFNDYSVVLDFPTKGLSFLSYIYRAGREEIDLKRQVGVLKKELPVTWVYYYSPSSLENVLKNVFLYPPEMTEYFLDNTREWNGFGEIPLLDYQRWGAIRKTRQKTSRSRV